MRITRNREHQWQVTTDDPYTVLGTLHFTSTHLEVEVSSLIGEEEHQHFQNELIIHIQEERTRVKALEENLNDLLSDKAIVRRPISANVLGAVIQKIRKDIQNFPPSLDLPLIFKRERSV